MRPTGLPDSGRSCLCILSRYTEALWEASDLGRPIPAPKESEEILEALSLCRSSCLFPAQHPHSGALPEPMEQKKDALYGCQS